MKEAYCSYKISKLLKEKGFDEKVFTYYEDKVLKEGLWFEWNRSPLGHIAAPTHQMACAWLRDVHNIFILVGWNWLRKEYFTRIYDMTNGYPKRNIHEYTDYNRAIEAAIKYSLENLI